MAQAALATPPWSERARGLAWSAIRDTLAIGVAGLGEEATRTARATVTATTPRAGEIEAVWLETRHLSVADAAFVGGGVAGHALDWDDYMHPMHGHCSAVLLPVAWSLTRAAGGGAQMLVDAFLAGYQVDHLLSLVTSHGHYGASDAEHRAKQQQALAYGLDDTRAAEVMAAIDRLPSATTLPF